MLKNSTNFTSNYNANVILLPQIKIEMKDTSISHKGIVESIIADIVTVTITSVSACSSCQAKSACNSSEMQEKKIEARKGNKQLKIGDWVTVTTKESMGVKAVFLGYILPFIIVLISLIICNALTINESVSGLVSLAVLIPYYTVLYLLRNIIKKTFIFEIDQ